MSCNAYTGTAITAKPIKPSEMSRRHRNGKMPISAHDAPRAFNTTNVHAAVKALESELIANFWFNVVSSDRKSIPKTRAVTSKNKR
jgi:hypothetical protein